MWSFTSFSLQSETFELLHVMVSGIMLSMARIWREVGRLPPSPGKAPAEPPDALTGAFDAAAAAPALAGTFALAPLPPTLSSAGMPCSGSTMTLMSRARQVGHAKVSLVQDFVHV